MASGSGCSSETNFQPVTERHQCINLSDYTALFSERRNGKKKLILFLNGNKVSRRLLFYGIHLISKYVAEKHYTKKCGAEDGCVWSIIGRLRRKYAVPVAQSYAANASLVCVNNVSSLGKPYSKLS